MSPDVTLQKTSRYHQLDLFAFLSRTKRILPTVKLELILYYIKRIET